MFAAPGDYVRCGDCGHETLVRGADQVFMVNDAIPNGPPPNDWTTRFQRAVALRATPGRDRLVDVGSGIGKFLFHVRGAFAEVSGVEITPACAAYARSFGLRIDDRFPAQVPSLVTFWHSLEHIPPDAIASTLAEIRTQAAPATRVVISVPNARSLQARLYGPKWAYYDVPAHIHQFTPASLDLLMQRYGFRRELNWRGLPYAAFGQLQGLLNLLITPHNYLYYRGKRGQGFGFSAGKQRARDALSVALAVALAPVAGVLTLMELAVPGWEGAVTACYRPR